MSKITKFDKPTLRALRGDINAALAAVGAKHGIDLHAGNARFDANTVTFKLNCALLDSDGKAETKEMLDLKAIHPELVNKRISIGPKTHGTIIGFKVRSQKYPFLLQTPKGVYKISSVQAGLPELY